MSNSSRRNTVIVFLLVLLLLLLLLLLRCRPTAPVVADHAATPSPAATAARPSTPGPAGQEAAEVLTPATVQAPAQVPAGATLAVAWTGPNNKGDYVIIVPKGAPKDANGNYRLTAEGPTLQLTAPIAPGDCEVRYVTGHSQTILGRAAITVAPVAATLDAPPTAGLGTTISVAWTGPNNQGDYITLVANGQPDGQYDNYAYTAKGSPAAVLVPIKPGGAELRYMTGQGNKVLARRPLTITAPDVSLAAAAEAVAGSNLSVTWTGPGNQGDYVAIAVKGSGDGQYANFTYTNKGSPLVVLVPVMVGDAELRYMTGQGGKVLARRPLAVVAAEVSLTAPATAVAGSNIGVTWTGPNHQGDYIAIAAMGKPDGQYANYTYTAKGSPLSVLAPIMVGDAELRYMTGQGGKVIARRPITITAAEITLSTPATAAAGSAVSITWTGPGNPGDFIALVAAGKPDNQFGNYAYTNKGSPLTLAAPKEAGDAEVRYLAGQGNKVLSRRTIKVVP